MNALLRNQLLAAMVICTTVVLLTAVQVGAQSKAPVATPHQLFLPLIARQHDLELSATATATQPVATLTPVPTRRVTSMPSATATATATSTPVLLSNTATSTAITTPSATVTATSTAIPPASATPTLMNSATPTFTSTAPLPPSDTPTITATPTAADPPTFTATATNTAAPIDSATPTHTATPTNTPNAGTQPQPCNQSAQDLILRLADLPDGWSLVEEGEEILGDEVVALGAVGNYTARYINYLQLLTDTSALVNVVIVFQTEAGASGYVALLAEVAALDPSYTPITIPTIGDETLAYEAITSQQGFDFTNYHVYVRKRNIAFVLTTVALSTVATVDDAQAWSTIRAAEICDNRR